MRFSSRHFMQCLAASLALSALTPRARAQVHDVRYVEPVDNAAFGMGFSYGRRQVYNPCVTFDRGSITPRGGGVSGAGWRHVKSNAEMLRESGTDLGASLDAFGVSLGGSWKAISKEASSQHNVSVFAWAKTWDDIEYIDGSTIRLTDEARGLLERNPGQFRHLCGDGLLIGLQRGREFIGRVDADTRKQSESSDTRKGFNGGYKEGKNDGSVKASFIDKMSSAFGADNLSVTIWSTNATLNPSGAEGLRKVFEGFSNDTSAKRVVRMAVVPFTVAVNHPNRSTPWPYANLAGVDRVISAAWDYASLVADAKFVLDNPALFALGISPEVRARTRGDVRQLQRSWEAEGQRLQALASACMKGETALCDDERVPDVLRQRAALPQRYAHRCGGWQVSARALNGAFNQRFRSFGDPVLGDAELGGGPSRFDVTLSVIPDGSKLFVEWRLRLREWKIRNGKRSYKGGHNTEFERTFSALLADLKRPAAALESTEALGIRPGNHRLDACRLVPMGGALGVVDALNHVTGKNPRKVDLPPGRVIKAMTCEGDRNGKDRDLECARVQHAPLELTLFHVEDLRYQDDPRLDALRIQRDLLKGQITTFRSLQRTWRLLKGAEAKTQLRDVDMRLKIAQRRLQVIMSNLDAAQRDVDAVRRRHPAVSLPSAKTARRAQPRRRIKSRRPAQTRRDLQRRRR